MYIYIQEIWKNINKDVNSYILYVNYTSKVLLKNVHISHLVKMISNYNFFPARVYFPNFLNFIFITLIQKIGKNYFQKSYTVHSIV